MSLLADSLEELSYEIVDSPVGKLAIYVQNGLLVKLEWLTPKVKKNLKHHKNSPRNSVIVTVKRQLREYFAGKRTEFKIPFKFHGTKFQIKAWRQLCKVPYGTTNSYSDQAKAIGHPTAFRAVGTANSQNPIAIIVPCHRIIASDGKISGFAGMVGMKEKLLEIEGAW